MVSGIEIIDRNAPADLETWGSGVWRERWVVELAELLLDAAKIRETC